MGQLSVMCITLGDRISAYLLPQLVLVTPLDA